MKLCLTDRDVVLENEDSERKNDNLSLTGHIKSDPVYCPNSNTWGLEIYLY